MRQVVVSPSVCEADFAGFGALIDRPTVAGERRFYSDWLGGNALEPVFHVNSLKPVGLPHQVSMLERHPHAAQCFVPLDVSRYLLLVAPSLADGAPDLDGVRAFIAPGTLGVVYAPGVWHAGAAVLDRDGAFAVLMWRNAPSNDDDVFQAVEPLQLVGPGAGQ